MDIYQYRGFTLMRITGGIWVVSGLLPTRSFPSNIEAERAIDRQQKG